RIDIGVLIPIDRAKASGSSRSTVTALNVPANRCVTVTNATTRATSQLCSPVSAASDIPISEGLCLQAINGRFWCPSSENNVTGTSSGLGDITIRGKFSILSTPMMDLGAGVDLRNPTGDIDKFLGLGKPQLKVMVMGSKTFGMLAPHFNVGYTFS